MGGVNPPKVLMHQLVVTCILNECEAPMATRRSIAALYAVLLPLHWDGEKEDWAAINATIIRRFRNPNALKVIQGAAVKMYAAAHAAITAEPK